MSTSSAKFTPPPSWATQYKKWQRDALIFEIRESTNLTYKELGEKFNLTFERIRQITAKQKRIRKTRERLGMPPIPRFLT